MWRTMNHYLKEYCNANGTKGLAGNVIQAMLVIILVIIKLAKSSKDLQ